MRPPETIQFGGRRPRGVAVAGPCHSAESERRAAERERAQYERGVIDGQRSLAGQLLQQRKDVLELQNGVLAALQRAVPAVVRQTERDLVEISLEVTRRLVGEVAVTGPMVEFAVRDALAQISEATDFVVRVHPEDLELLRSMDSRLLPGGDAPSRIDFQAAPEVARGGCLVQTRFGLVDALRETKFAHLRAAALGGEEESKA